MSFHNWYSKSIEEAQDRYKKEDEVAKEPERGNIDIHRDLYDSNYGSISMEDDIDEDLLRLDDDGGWTAI
jgi:hypothetical protein